MSLRGRQGSSVCIEFFLSLVVGLLAILGALFIIGFLLVDPVRHSPGQSAAGYESARDNCEPSVKPFPLPHGCYHGNQAVVQSGYCSNRECACEESEICCCRATNRIPVQGIVCQAEVDTPTILNTTNCGCAPCDDITIQVHMNVVNRDTEEPVSAAVILKRAEGSGDHSYFGLTNENGLFMFSQSLGEGVIELKIMAAGFNPYLSQPIRLRPDRKVVRVSVLLIPAMSMEIGLGGSPISLRLGPSVSITAPPGSLSMSDGSMYEDSVKFEGMFETAGDQTGFKGLPGADFNIRNEATGEVDVMAVLFVTRLQFMGVEGEELSTDQLSIQVSLPADADWGQLCLLCYNETSRQWEKHSDFTPQAGTISKRQTRTNIVLENPATPLQVYAAIANFNNLECWLQARTFDVDLLPLTDRVVNLEVMGDRSGAPLFISFRARTGAQADFNIVENGVCLPIECGSYDSGSLLVEDDSGTSLIPIDFPPETFGMLEARPFLIGGMFIFDTLIPANETSLRPFYTSVAECVSTGVLEGVGESSYFNFRELDQAVATPLPTDSCFIKFQILDCFGFNSVELTVIDPVTFVSNRTDFIVVELFEDTTEMPGSGTTMPPVMTTQGSTECDLSTATLRAACLPYRCGSDIQLLVRPNPDSGSTALFCQVTDRSVIFSSPLVSNTDNTNQFITRDAASWSQEEHNDPLLGVWFQPGNNVMAAATAEQLCNAGTGGGMSSTIDPFEGVAVQFSCF